VNEPVSSDGEASEKGTRPSAQLARMYKATLKKSKALPDPVRRNELKVYMSLLLPLDDDEPLSWWVSHKHVLPVMFRLARKFLAIPATSVASERIWSDAGNIVTKKRSRLLPEKVGKIVVCYEGRKYL
jgi:hypothetical protein